MASADRASEYAKQAMGEIVVSQTSDSDVTCRIQSEIEKAYRAGYAAGVGSVGVRRSPVPEDISESDFT